MLLKTCINVRALTLLFMQIFYYMQEKLHGSGNCHYFLIRNGWVSNSGFMDTDWPYCYQVDDLNEHQLDLIANLGWSVTE